MSKKIKRIEGLFYDFWNQRIDDPEILSFLSPNVVVKDTSGMHLGRKGAHALWTESVFNSFPDFNVKCNEFEVSENQVIANIQSSGTYSTPYQESLQDSGWVYQSEFNKELETFETGDLFLEATYKIAFTFVQGKVSHMIYSDFEFSKSAGELEKKANAAAQEIPVDANYHKLIQHLKGISSSTLTGKETECFALSLTGLSARLIGNRMGLSHRTIETHLRHVFWKLGVDTKLQSLEMMIENYTLPVWHALAHILIYQKYQMKAL